MYEKIFDLIPVKIKFGLYDSNNTVVKNAPPFWSRHKHYIENSYNYCVNKRHYDEIEFELESTCSRRKIVFEDVKIKLEEYVKKLKEAYSLSQNFISFEVAITYENLDETFCDMSCIRQTDRCKSISKSRPQFDTVYIYFDSEKLKEAIEEYDKKNSDICNVEPASIPSVQIETIKPNNNKEEQSMQELFNPTTNQPQVQSGMQNPFANMGGFDFKFGPVNDERIASTMFGVVFKGENGRWYKYDKENGVRTDMTGMNFGNLPMMLFPASRNDVKKGDLILYNNEYYYVKKKKETNFILISASTGVETKVYPATNILNMEIFTKVFVLMDSASLKGLGGKDLTSNFMLAMMLGMSQPANSNDANGTNFTQQWMPLLLMLKGGDTPFAGLFDKVSEGNLTLETMLPFFCMTQMGNQVMPSNIGLDPFTMYVFMQQFMSGFSSKKAVSKKKKKKKKVAAKTDTSKITEKEKEETSAIFEDEEENEEE